MNYKIFRFGYLFLPLVAIIYFSSCNGASKNAETEITHSQEYLDSVEEVRAQNRILKEIEDNKKRGRYRAIDTIQFGELEIIVDSVRKKLNAKRYIGNTFASYDVYISLTNTSENQTLPIPYIFPEKTGEDKRVAANGTGSYFELGTRLFRNTKTNKIIDNFDVHPGKTINGYYTVINTSLRSTSVSLSYGDFSILSGKDADDKIPEGYKDKKVYIDLKSKIPTIKKEE